MSTTTGSSGQNGPSDATSKQKLVANERAKLTATAFNNGAVAAAIASVIGPGASFLYGISVPKARYWGVFAAAWLIVAFGLHLAARKTLGDLEP